MRELQDTIIFFLISFYSYSSRRLSFSYIRDTGDSVNVMSAVDWPNELSTRTARSLLSLHPLKVS